MTTILEKNIGKTYNPFTMSIDTIKYHTFIYVSQTTHEIKVFTEKINLGEKGFPNTCPIYISSFLCTETYPINTVLNLNRILLFNSYST